MTSPTFLKPSNKIKPNAKIEFSQNSQRKTLFLKGLDCADCAGKIEKMVKKQSEVRLARLDFLSQKLFIESNDGVNFPKLLRKITTIINELEPDVKVSFSEQKKENDKEKKEYKKISFFAGVLLFVTAIALNLPDAATFILYLSAYILVGKDVLIKALKNIKNRQIFDENFLMSIATIGAFFIGEYPEGVAVMLFYKVGEYFQSLAVNRSRKSISKLINLKAEYANLVSGNKITKVAPETVGIGEILAILPGEKVPLDGVVISGNSNLDISALSGESLPKETKTGDKILSGSVNLSALLHVKVTEEFSNSTVNKILELIENASSKKSQTENFITKFARYYTPFVVVVAFLLALLPPLFLANATFGDWIYRALVFLVISCPCALVISIPLSYFGGIAASSKKGILVKGSSYLEALNSVKTVVFDKTGTLTKGVFKVKEVVACNKFKKEELLYLAAMAESFSTHPIATSLAKSLDKKIDKTKVTSSENLSGFGVKSVVDGREVLVGNEKLMEKFDIDYKKIKEAQSTVHVAIDKVYAGYIEIDDEIKEDSYNLSDNLKELGVENIVVLSGDSEFAAKKIANELKIDQVYSSLLPHQKVEILETIMQTEGGKVAFVGDGINDAPSLKRADIGIAMGKFGSDAAIESADIVLTKDEPSRVVDAIKIAKKTRNIAVQNIVFALGVKAVLLTLGALGIATMWEAVFGDVGVTIIAVLNASRAMRAV